MKDHLIFDTTNAASILDSDSVGAFVRSADGTLITHHVVSGNKHLDVYSALADGSGSPLTSTGGALNVNMTNAININVDGVYNVSTNADPDNAGLIVHTRAASPGDVEQTKRTTGAQANADGVVAANVHGQDVNAFGMVYNGTTWDRMTGTAGAVNVNLTGSSATVTTNDAALANIAIAAINRSLPVADTAAVAVISPLANRKYLFLYNMDNQKVYIGGAGVTAATGFPVSPGSYLEMRAGAASAVNFVGSAGKTPEIRSLELS
jgi:hypothetical protein